MSLPDQLSGLLDPQAYSHACGEIILVETHISWVVLTGEFVYKLKKPVEFSFVDFSTLARRRHFCEEELRCNSAFAPSLYLGLASVSKAEDGQLQVADAPADPGEEAANVIEWAVKMRQFPAESQADRLLEQDQLEPKMLSRFGTRLAQQHAALPTRRCDRSELQSRVLDPVWENFDDIASLEWTASHSALLARARDGVKAQLQQHGTLLADRLQAGWIRECHGDLHLSNMVMLEDGISAFDCLEFNPLLRWIDPQSDVAFLFMDCLIRQRADLAYSFLGGYLDASGDYNGMRLLPFYASYRSMVRAKVAALRRNQVDGASRREAEQRFLSHVRWASDWLQRPPGQLLLMCGLSGSGKSYLAERLAPQLPAVRLRSDVARKALAGLRPDESAQAPVGEGIYRAGHTEAVYRYLMDLAGELLRTGEHVIVDATFLDPQRRADFLAAAAERGARGAIVYCDAPLTTLRQRILDRAKQGTDASDADLAVLEEQRRDFTPPEEHTIRVDTQRTLDAAILDSLVEQIRGLK